VGDFSIIQDADCDINQAAIAALSYVDICGATICNLLILRYFIVRYKSKNSLFFISSDPKTLFPICFLLHGIGDFVFAVLKSVYDVQPVVGRDLSVTLIASILPFFCFCGLVLYYAVIIKFLKGYSRMMRPESREKVDLRFASLMKNSWALPPISLLPGLMPLFGLRYPEHVPVLGMVYLIGNGVLAICYGLFFNFALGFLLEELSIHLRNNPPEDNEDIQLVYNRLNLAHRIGSTLFFIIGFSYVIFGSWEMLLRKSSYLFLIIQITTHPTFTILILTVSHITHTRSKTAPLKIRSSACDVRRSSAAEVEMKIDVQVCSEA
jgi:hypothetical protein